MDNKIGFDTDKYLQKQVEKLSERLYRFERLYLEFGGKLFSDMHASRVLPGYRPTAKIELLKKLGKIDLFYCVCGQDLVKGRIRGDSGLTYDLQVFKDVSNILNFGLEVSGIIITRFEGQPPAMQLKRKLESYSLKVFFQNTIEGYPTDMEKIMKGYEKQPYVKPRQSLVVVTGTGPGSGKMAFCLSQIYHERKERIKSGFAKFETFPIWCLPLNHPINIAYEAATADLHDIDEIDPFHKKEYGITAINYNRDIENFAILKNLLKKITKEEYPFGYKSPTDMGVNMAAEGIVDDRICKKAANQEIIRRYFRYHREKIEGKETQATTDWVDEIMKKADLKPEDRKVVLSARQAAKDARTTGKGHNGLYCGAAIELKDGQIITGKNSSVLHAESAAILNAIKVLAEIPDRIDLISPNVLKEISEMKGKLSNKNFPSLTVDEMLIALSASSAINPSAKAALDKIEELKNCEMHVTILPSTGDEVGLRILNINLSTDAQLASLQVLKN